MRTTTHIKNSLLALALMGGVFAAPLAHAQQAKPTSDKLDVSGLEKKYWASKDTDFSVVQNRTYSKVHRFSIAAEYGSLLNDAYSSGPLWTFTGNYYFTERYGVELIGMVANLTDSDSTKNFEHLSNGSGVRPNFNRTSNYYGASFNWVPVYAKMSLLNSKIIYFDMAFSPGFGVQQYDQQVQAGTSHSTISNGKSGIAGQFAITQHYFFSNHWSLRVDWTNRWASEKVADWLGNGAGGHNESSNIHHDSILSGGLTFLF